MSKLGYTWYPKDFISDPDVMFMTAAERGVYRDIIDLAYMNNNNIRYTPEMLAKYTNSDVETVNKILELKGKKIGEFWTIPNCNKRMELSEKNRKNGSKGGRPKTQTKPKNNPNETQSETQNERQRERERERESKIEIEIKKEEEYICDFSETEFVEFFKTKRLEIDKQKSGYDKLITFEKQNFNRLKNLGYKKQDFEDAVSGLFFQKTLPAVRIRPDWILKEENFLKMIDSWRNQNKIFSSDIDKSEPKQNPQTDPLKRDRF